MSKINVDSNRQSGGITVGVLNVGASPGRQPEQPRFKRIAKLVAAVSVVVGIAAGAAQLADYLEWKPWRPASLSVANTPEPTVTVDRPREPPAVRVTDDVQSRRQERGSTAPSRSKRQVAGRQKKVPEGQMSDDDKKNEFHVTSNNQQGGITAGQINVGRPARHLDEPNRNQLRALIPKGSTVAVQASLGEAEAYGLAEELYEFLRSGGYKVKPFVSQVITVPPQKGVGVQPNADGSWTIVVGAQE